MKQPSPEEIQAQAAALLEDLDTSYRPTQSETAYGPYHRAAAVLSSFDAHTLRPVAGSANNREDDLPELLQDCVAARESDVQHYALLPNIRREVLEQLGTQEEMQAALQINAGQIDTTDPAMLEAYIRGNAPPLTAQDAGQIANTYQAVQWLDGLINDLPTQAAVRQRWEYLDLLRPCDMLAGKKFRGRETELGWLRSYVFEQGSEGVAKPPLVIHGPGGVGKSALVARFIQDIADQPIDKRIPWAYIDFDRPGIDPEEPLTILIDAVRQLGIQYPDGRENAGRFRKFLQAQLADRVRAAKEVRNVETKQAYIGKGTQEPEWQSYLGNFASLLTILSMASWSAQAADVTVPPFLLVLDTFEEVQYRSSAIVERLFNFLQALRQAVPQSRPVAVGRNTVQPQTMQSDNRELGDFEPEAARALLEAEGIPPDLAKQIVKQVGSTALSLRLVADLWHRGLMDKQGLADLEIDLEFQIQEGQIQGVLFARILDHIHDPEVQRLAHPGLVLRRVTPELITTVLAKDCDVEVPNLERAKELFDRLAEEEALVTLEGDVLRHRSDVRRIMVRLLREKEPQKVRAIEQAAVKYYSKRESAEERAEEIYHRLTLKQSLSRISERWADAEKRGWTQEMRRALFSAREELGPRQRAWLATRFDFELTEEEAAEADQASWEDRAEKSARRFLEYDQPERALEAMEQRPQWLPGSSLYLLATQALERLNAWEKARDVLERGILSAAQRGDRSLAVEMRLHGVRVDLKVADFVTATRRLEQAERLLRNSQASLSLIEIGLYRLAVARAANDEAAVTATVERLLECFEQTPDRQAITEPAVLAWLAAEIGARHKHVMARALGLIGLSLQISGQAPSAWLPTKSSGLEAPGVEPVSHLVVALAAWDDATSAKHGQPPGALARGIGIKATRRATPSQIWRTYLYEAKPEESGRSLAGLLDGVDVPAAVLQALAAVMLQRAGERALSPEAMPKHPLPDTKAPAVLGEEPKALPASHADTIYQQPIPRNNLTMQQMQGLRHALLDAFPNMSALEELLYMRFDRRLEAIALGGNLNNVVFQLLQTAQREGWLLELVDAARNANPTNQALATIATELGVGPVELDKPVLEGIPKLADAAEFAIHLAQIASRVCRIEVGSSPQIMGTGFLLGPDVVMTAHAVIELVMRGDVPPSAVSLRFDYKTSADGSVVNPGVVFALERDWLVDARPYDVSNNPDDLGYALLRVAGQPGYSGIGSSRALESFAELRGWIEVPSIRPDLKPGSPLFILHQRQDPSLMLSAGSIVGVDAGFTVVHYSSNTASGSSGAPCFDSGWNLVALHLGGTEHGNFGTTFIAILDLLKRHDQDGSLGGARL